MLAYGIWGPVAGQLIDRLGARVAYSFGLVSLGLAYLLAGFSTQLWQYMQTFSPLRLSFKSTRCWECSLRKL